MPSNMPRDARVRGEAGRYETRLIIRAPNGSTTDLDAPGNGARVALIACALFDEPTFGAAMRVAVKRDGLSVPFAILSPERPSLVATLADYGDVITQPVSLVATVAVTIATLWEVVWHPFEG